MLSAILLSGNKKDRVAITLLNELFISCLVLFHAGSTSYTSIHGLWRFIACAMVALAAITEPES
jgi:hypothetical protein